MYVNFDGKQAPVREDEIEEKVMACSIHGCK